MSGVRHLYVHVPFCAHRCGYCDFVTVVGRARDRSAYVDAMLAELELERSLLADRLETVFVGGGTPTFVAGEPLRRLLGALPDADEITVEANPETVAPSVAQSLRRSGATRVSLGAQSFQPRLLAILERRATPAAVRSAFYHLRDAGFDNISLDLLYGIPGQTATDLERDLAAALELEPEHLSCYELEAKPGTRFTHAWAAELERQGEALEGHFELVVDTLVGAGFRWYETASFCRDDRQARHNLGYWRGRDYLGIGIGAVSTVDGLRWSNRPGLSGYLAALAQGGAPPREVEVLSAETQRRERLMLGLRLDEFVPIDEIAPALDHGALTRMLRLELVERADDGIRLTRRGRLLGGGVTVELLAETGESPANSAVTAGPPASIES